MKIAIFNCYYFKDFELNKKGKNKPTNVSFK